jgi:AraC-like DNA-binding protein
MSVQHERTENNFPLHQHQKSQLMYVTEGLAFVVTPDHTYYLPARHYVWIPPRLEHRLLVRSAQYRLHSLCFAQADDAAHPFYSVLGIYPVTTLLYELLLYTEWWQGLVAPSEADAYLFLRNLKAVLPHISPHALPIALPTSDHPRLLPVLNYLSHHLDEPLELVPLARQFGFSARTLARLFQQVLHLSFGQYLKLRRITAAMELLIEGQHSVGEVAYAVGYHSLPAFSNAFLQLVSRRPTDFLPNA